MEKRVIVVNQDLQELCSHGTPSFPMTVSYDDLSHFEDRYIRCHWHDDLEVVLVRQGTVRYQIGNQSLSLRPGQGLFLNSDSPHSAFPLTGGSTVLLTILIQPVFLYDFLGSDIEKNCFRSFLHNKKLPYLLLDSKEPWMGELLEQFAQVIDYYERRPFAFELKIKSLLCGCFFQILTRNRDRLEGGAPVSQEKLRRLGILLDYLHAHYEENISLSDLAFGVHLTRESCCRLFKEMTGKTITQYLTDYRISQSIRLLSDGRYSIAQIAELSGFSSASRFARAFRLRTGKNPRDYLSSGDHPDSRR